MEVSELIVRVETDRTWPGKGEVIRAGGNRKERTYRMEKTYVKEHERRALCGSCWPI